MESSRTLQRHGNLYPAIYSLLAELPVGSIPHAAHRLRPPGGIYNFSIGRVLDAFGSMFIELEALGAIGAGDHAAFGKAASKVLSVQTELLEAVMAHIDDGYQILKACHPFRPDLEEKFASQWLEKAGHRTVRIYTNGVRAYRDHVAPIVNRVKHEHGQLRLVTASDGLTRIDGYYLEGVFLDGSVGPDPQIHPGCTAFSFNRDLRFHFVHLFEIGKALKAALSPALRQLGIRPSGQAVQNASESLLAVAEKLEALGALVFPDEEAKATPWVAVQRSASDVRLTIRYPSLAVYRAQREMRITTLSKSDGFTNQFRVPYWQPRS